MGSYGFSAASHFMCGIPASLRGRPALGLGGFWGALLCGMIGFFISTLLGAPTLGTVLWIILFVYSFPAIFNMTITKWITLHILEEGYVFDKNVFEKNMNSEKEYISSDTFYIDNNINLSNPFLLLGCPCQTQGLLMNR